MKRTLKRVPVAAKVNLALVVGPRREDGLHELASVVQRIDLCDFLRLEPGDGLAVHGFSGDTLVTSALTQLAEAAGTEPGWRVELDKRIPLAAGLGGGSADAGVALKLANSLLERPLSLEALTEVAATVGADVPFFLGTGPRLAEGAGERLTPLDLPQDYYLVVALPVGFEKNSTGDVYERFDELGGAVGFEERREALVEAARTCKRPRDFAAFPRNDLAEAASGSRELVVQLLAHGAFRADVSGAGPAVYGLFHHGSAARQAARRLVRARTWVTAPVW